MLTAHLSDQSIFAPDVDDIGRIRAYGQARRLTCPLCGGPVHFRGRPGGDKIWHFAHFQSASTCTQDDPDYAPESTEHQLLKWAFYRHFLDELGASAAQVECRVETGQVADILVSTGGHRLAFEIQRSPLSPEDWAERRRSYRSIGIHDVWVLVGSRHLSDVDRPQDHRVALTRESGERSPDKDPRDERAEGLRKWDLQDCRPSPLARALLRQDGRLLWIPDTGVDELREDAGGNTIPAPHRTRITELSGLWGVYRDAPESPTEVAQEHRRRPIYEQPTELLGGTGAGAVHLHLSASSGSVVQWRDVAEKDRIPVVCFPPAPLGSIRLRLDRIPIRDGDSPPQGAEEVASPADESSAANTSPSSQNRKAPTWVWEFPNVPLDRYDWAWDWDKARVKWVASLARRREAIQRQTDAQKRVRREALLEAIGEAIWPSLSKLLDKLQKLRVQASKMTRQEVRNHPAIEPGMRKWPVETWTPLANLETGLNWIFGTDRRLWQAMAYCSHFYHPYARRYRDAAGISTTGYDYSVSGYLLKALHFRGVASQRPAIEAAFRSANSAVTDLIAESNVDLRLRAHDWFSEYGPRVGEITYNGLCRVATASYMARLADLGFLRGSSRPVGITIGDHIRRAREIVRAAESSGRTPSSVLLQGVGERWMEVSWLIQKVVTDDYTVDCPFHPPYFPQTERPRIAQALRSGKLQPTQDGLFTTDGEQLTSFDWKS